MSHSTEMLVDAVLQNTGKLASTRITLREAAQEKRAVKSGLQTNKKIRKSISKNLQLYFATWKPI